jgi:hypothetical protein
VRLNGHAPRRARRAEPYEAVPTRGNLGLGPLRLLTSESTYQMSFTSRRTASGRA